MRPRKTGNTARNRKKKKKRNVSVEKNIRANKNIQELNDSFITYKRCYCIVFNQIEEWYIKVKQIKKKKK